MKNLLNKIWMPSLISLFVLVAATFVVYYQSMSLNDGQIAYTIDDPYIHMAIAKNIVENGTYGIDSQGFTSSSSSPLWTMIMSGAFAIFGIHDSMAFILSFISAVLLLIMFNILLRKYISPVGILAAQLAVILAMPLVPLIFTGMEHILHSVVLIALLYQSVLYLSDRDGGNIWVMAFLSFVAVGLRFESGFLILTVAIILAFRKQMIAAAVISVFGLLPIFITGAISLVHGWHWLPTSVLLKANIPDNAGIIGYIKPILFAILKRLTLSPHLLIMIVATLALIIRLKPFRNSQSSRMARSGLIVIFTTSILHLQFADVGWFYRYEGYLMVAIIFSIAYAWESIKPDISQINKQARIGFWVLLLIAASPIITRGLDSLRSTAPATNNIYCQQRQMAGFISENLNGETVVLNDIGAVNFYADINTVDLWGLANYKIAMLRRQGLFNAEMVRPLIESSGAGYAFIYYSWYDYLIPFSEEWQTVATLKLTDKNIVCGDDIVHIYAKGPKRIESLKNKLKHYTSKLPKGCKLELIEKCVSRNAELRN